MKKLLIYVFSLVVFFSSCSQLEQEIQKMNDNAGNGSSEFITLESGVIVEKRGNLYYYHDDIILSEDQLKRLDETGSIFCAWEEIEANKPENGIPVDPTTGMTVYYEPNITKAVGRNPSQNMFWSMLRFAYSSSLTSTQKSQIKDAMDYMESVTNIRFFDATNEPTHDPTYGFEYPCVVFTPSDKNSSQVGRIGGKQILNLVNFYSRGIIVHEICHALGMFHEQSRADRDDYLIINYSNIPNGSSNTNFRKETNNYYMIGALDYNSIMMYGSWDFAINPSIPTITKKDGSTFNSNLEYMTENDRRFINTFYIPYIARQDVCVQLDNVVYDSNNNVLTESQRIALEKQLNINRCSYPLPIDPIVSMKTSKNSVSFNIKNHEVVKIHWGDGSIQTINPSSSRQNVSHSYSSSTNRTIKIEGRGTAITEISVDRNNLTEFDAAKCTELTYLSISYNNLSKVEPAKHPKLVNLGFADNSGITSVDLSKNPYLTHVSADKTNISSLNVSNNRNLLYASFSHTNVSSINLTNNPSVYTLIFHASKISSLNISQNRNLKTIMCRSTPLASNSTNFTNFVNSLPSRVSYTVKGEIDYMGNSSNSSVLASKHWYLKY